MLLFQNVLILTMALKWLLFVCMYMCVNSLASERHSVFPCIIQRNVFFFFSFSQQSNQRHLYFREKCTIMLIVYIFLLCANYVMAMSGFIMCFPYALINDQLFKVAKITKSMYLLWLVPAFVNLLLNDVKNCNVN
jgi:hypothetical protein